MAAAHTRPAKSKNTFGLVGTPQMGRFRGQETNNKQLVKQIVEATPYKRATGPPPTFDLANHLRKTNKTFWALLMKLGRFHFGLQHMDAPVLADYKDIHISSVRTTDAI